MIRKRRNQKEISTPKTEVGKILMIIRYLYLENILVVSRVSSYFPMGGHSVTELYQNYENVHKVQTSNN